MISFLAVTSEQGTPRDSRRSWFFQGHQPQRREVDGMGHRRHGLDGPVSLAAVGGAEQGGPGAGQAAGRVILVVLAEARIVFQQHGEGHLLALLGHGVAQRAAQLVGFQAHQLLQARRAQLVQIEVQASASPTSTAKRSRRSASASALSARRHRHRPAAGPGWPPVPGDLQANVLVGQDHVESQFVARLVEHLHRPGVKSRPGGSTPGHPLQHPLPILVRHLGEGAARNAEAARARHCPGAR